MAPRPTVSVVIPTRDRVDLLHTAVSSVLAQDFSDFEVILVDDHSDPPVKHHLPFQDPRIKVLRNEEAGGPAVARNQGVAASRGVWVAFLDDDDRWLPDKLSSCLRCASRHEGAGLLIHRTDYHGRITASSGVCEPVSDAIHRMLTQQPPHVDGVMVRAKIHTQAPFDENFQAAAELDYLLRIAQITEVIALDRVLAVHGPVARRSSHISVKARIEAREAFRAKHIRFFADPQVEAYHQIRLGHLNRRAGQRGRAAICFTKALRLGAGAAAWKGLSTTLLPERVVRWLGTR